MVDNYRAAHTVYVRLEAGDGDTEALRQSMVHYRALFQELLDDTPDEPRAAGQA